MVALEASNQENRSENSLPAYIAGELLCLQVANFIVNLPPGDRIGVSERLQLGTSEAPHVTATIPRDLDACLQKAWQAACVVPGFLTEPEARFLGMAAACTPAEGEIVEIGSFKGKSSVMIAGICRSYQLRPVIAIDPHNFNNPPLHVHRTAPDATTYDEYLRNLESAGVREFVVPHRKYSAEVSSNWNLPIRVLWIDGDHSYQGAKDDLDGFFPFLQTGGIVAFHDALHEDPGPIRVFVEEILRSDQFGPAGFVGSIAWAQFRPDDGSLFREQRLSLARLAQRLLPFVEAGTPLTGLRKLSYKLNRSRVPRNLPFPAEWVMHLNTIPAK